MKITILTNDFLPSVGGIEIFTKLIAEEMALRGHQISIVTNTPNKNKKDIGLFSIYRKNNFYSKFKVFKNSDLIIAINMSLKNFIFYLIFIKKIIISHHINYESNSFLGIFLNKIKKKLCIFFTNVTCSNYLNSKFNNNNQVIYNCYNDKIFKINKIKKTKDFIYCGRLDPNKGLMNLLNAFYLLLKKKKSNLSIVGDGPQYLELKEFIKKRKMQKYVKLYGNMQNNKLYNIMNKHTAMIIPSLHYETFGIVALEGIASTNIVISSNRGGLNEAIGKCGILIEPSIKNLYIKMLDVKLRDKKILKKIKEISLTRQKHLKKFSIKKITNDFLKLHEKL